MDPRLAKRRYELVEEYLAQFRGDGVPGFLAVGDRKGTFWYKEWNRIGVKTIEAAAFHVACITGTTDPRRAADVLEMMQCPVWSYKDPENPTAIVMCPSDDEVISVRRCDFCASFDGTGFMEISSALSLLRTDESYWTIERSSQIPASYHFWKWWHKPAVGTAERERPDVELRLGGYPAPIGPGGDTVGQDG
jgi:hypothetical protein